MQKGLMGMFFNAEAADFMQRWKIIRKKGFWWFYVRSVLRFFLFFIVLFICNNLLIERQIPFSDGDSAAVLAIFALISAGISFLLWRKYEGAYRRRLEKRKALHGGKNN